VKRKKQEGKMPADRGLKDSFARIDGPEFFLTSIDESELVDILKVERELTTGNRIKRGIHKLARIISESQSKQDPQLSSLNPMPTRISLFTRPGDMS
jgi:hypothetical protein